MSRQSTWSIKIFSRKSSQKTRNCLSLKTLGGSTYRFLTNFQSSAFGRWWRKTSNSWSTFRSSCQKDAYQTENTSSIFWTRSSHNMWIRLSSMQMLSGTPWQVRLKPKKQSKFQTSGGTPSTHHLSFHVSTFTFSWSAWYLSYQLMLLSPVCRTKGKNYTPT